MNSIIWMNEMPTKQSSITYSSEWRMLLWSYENFLNRNCHGFVDLLELVSVNLSLTDTASKDYLNLIVQVITHASQKSSGKTSTEHPRTPHFACYIHSYYPLRAWTFTPSTLLPLHGLELCSSPPTLADIPDQLCNSLLPVLGILEPGDQSDGRSVRLTHQGVLVTK